MSKKSLDDSIELLADTFRRVLSETVKDAVKPLLKDIAGIREDMVLRSTIHENFIVDIGEKLATQEEKINQLFLNNLRTPVYGSRKWQPNSS